MKCLDRRVIEEFLAGRLEPAQMVEVDEHLRTCAACRDLAAASLSARKAQAGFAEAVLQTTDCPDYEELSAFVDDNLEPAKAEAVTAHANTCELCTRDIERLRELRSHAALREKIAVNPGLDLALRPKPLGAFWRKTLAAVAGTAVVAALAVAFWPFGGVESPRTTVATTPPIVDQREIPQTQDTQKQVADGEAVVVQPPETQEEAPKPQARPVLADGSYQVVKKNGRLVLASADGSPATNSVGTQIAHFVSEKLNTGKIKPTQTARMAMAAIAVRDSSGYNPPPTAPKLVEPIGKIVMSTTPTLSWSKVDLAESYRLRVFDAQGRVVAEQITSKTSAAPDTALARGEIYSWRVGVRFSESDSWAESAVAKFRLLSSQDYTSIKRVKSRLAGSHLALGAAYEAYGLYDEAADEYRALRRQNPKSELARKFLVEAVDAGR